jgi:hypothetical protein
MGMAHLQQAYLSGLLILLVLASPHASYGQESSGTASGVAPTERCADLLNPKIEGLDLATTKADAIPTTPTGTVRASPFSPEPISVAIPSYCRVDGVIDQRTGVDGKPYGIGFAIALPDNWNGRFLFQGGIGLNGSIGDPFGASAAGKVPAIARGSAVIATDTGHKGQVFESSFRKDQPASLDFDYLRPPSHSPLLGSLQFFHCSARCQTPFTSVLGSRRRAEREQNEMPGDEAAIISSQVNRGWPCGWGRDEVFLVARGFRSAIRHGHISR